MAGPMVGPLLTRLGLDLVTAYWTPDGNFPDHEPNPLLAGEPRSSSCDKVVETGADLGIAWDGDADRCFFIDDTRRVRRRRLPHRARWRERAAREDDPRRRRSSTTCAPRAPCATSSRPPAAPRSSTGSATPSSRRACATRARPSAARSPATTTSSDFYNADSGTLPALLILELLSKKGAKLSELLAALRASYFISGEINSEVADQQAKMEAIAAGYADAEITRLDGVSVDYPDWHFNVRPRTPSRCCDCASSRSSPHADMERRRDEVLALIRG